jgi:ArsR family transcriptional regulator
MSKRRANAVPNEDLNMNATNQEISRASGVFRAISHPDRLKLLCLLGDGEPVNQKQLVERTGWPQSTVARHLAALKTSGLLTAQRRGTEVWFELSGPLGNRLMNAVCDWLRDPEESDPPSSRRLRRRPPQRTVRAS